MRTKTYQALRNAEKRRDDDADDRIASWCLLCCPFIIHYARYVDDIEVAFVFVVGVVRSRQTST